MYPNKLITSSMSSYSFFILTFFHKISCSACHKLVLSQHNCKIGSCKNKNSSNVNIQRCTKSKNKYSGPNSNFKLVQQISSIKMGLN